MVLDVSTNNLTATPGQQNQIKPKKKTDLESDGDIEEEVIKIDPMSCVVYRSQELRSEGFPYVFILKTSEEEHHFATQTEQEMKEWIKHIHALVPYSFVFIFFKKVNKTMKCVNEDIGKWT
ncbi:hypothetical protein RFI_13887 [Reticulomyxa filosa]|uniref:PH domain-containing protein n=1 Tax=Reticulomyxa filosa TaxID=46433 RepID=X6NBY0_RETFI|nr:hypothetical protein RFI_13887 [Reticulomyxa filosa]|eukprot:ETO23294.1 hypothetical protein RFI_13887 [Reticulomyxa filosa]